MSVPAEYIDLAKLSNGALCRLLGEAEHEEREISDRRREVHDLIDASSLDAEAASDVAAMSQQERQMSAARLQLHMQITELRLEKSRRVDGLRPSLKIVDSRDV
jgi:Spy/CpxP family protein refolding chaperone